jgi:hypothetical protein
VSSSLFRSRTDFIDFCDGLLNEHDRFISRHKRQRKRNFKVLKKNFEDLLDQHCKLLLVRVDVSYLYDANKDIRQFDADLNTFRRLIHLRQDSLCSVPVQSPMNNPVHAQSNRAEDE